MDKREKRAVNDMGTAMKRICEVLRRHPDERRDTNTNLQRALALEYAVGKAVLAVKRVQRWEEEEEQEAARRVLEEKKWDQTHHRWEEWA